ncbi:MAG TPA: serine/threonine-protein kinase, partial [Gemmatimonadaceae bacterium]|nr:serine/threonine-protein kinase [Gemmatimonadaceae bacterium]
MSISPLQEQVQQALGAVYTIQRELGGGGMSRVFLAEDRALGRMVVLKVLSPELAEGMSADRFAREIRLAARLQHPHIVPLFSAGQVDGLPYYTMPYVDGESLRVRLSREPNISVPGAMHILRDLARALEYAHAHDVVHRDIKPDNILLSGNSASVTDFGIAKAVSAARTQVVAETGSSQPLTQLGFAIGTPAYMAPEQAAGDPEIDHRADLYAFGCVAYELLAGRPPFSNRTPQALLVAHMVERPPLARLRRPDIPQGLADLVGSCLAKAPEDRPSGASELLVAIETGSHRAVSAAETAPSVASIAVLPFESMSADKENEYFADGITEEIINSLTQLEGLRVAGRTSAFSFKGTKHDLPTIGAKLNVGTVL